MAVVTSAAIAAGTTLYAASEQRKAGKEAARAIEAGRVDPEMVAQQTREQSLRNIRESLAAEQEFTPENARLRRSTIEALQPLVADQGSADQLAGIDRQIREGGDAGQSQLLTESIAEARRQLALGGELDVDTRNEITRQALARGGSAGQKARFLVPRDLGLTSMQLQQQRLEQGGRFGQVEQNRMQQSFNNLSSLRQLREQLSGARTQRGLSLASFGQSLQAPQIGLDPGEYAGLYVGNQNLTAQAQAQRAANRATNANNYARVGSQIGGLAGAVGNQYQAYRAGRALPEVSISS